MTRRRHPRAPGPVLQLLETRAWLEAGASLALLPVWRLAPRGDGHPVLILPGLAAGDESTAIMRQFLRSRGYAVSRWGRGRNLGFRAGLLPALRDQIAQLVAEHGRKLSLIGWSLGGIFARELAKQVPDQVRLVITMASPFTGHPRATNAFRLYEWMTGRRIGATEIHEPLREPPPVPTTSIWSRTDGVVSWRCSVERERPLVENIEINASHLGIGAHPLALYAVADRLAQPEGQWQSFRREGWRALAYGDARR
ncbi:MAG: alpha/beta fold hydrolase [Deltaproteobacteria bacterium]|nr:MAG: alpha/beta fold hydrolase [Deltaproteobacteria bacterium]TMQ28279.1 MAG: alpha/beta fold hydrolase [Deltaproteobacteria bacterium]